MFINATIRQQISIYSIGPYWYLLACTPHLEKWGTKIFFCSLRSRNLFCIPTLKSAAPPMTLCLTSTVRNVFEQLRCAWQSGSLRQTPLRVAQLCQRSVRHFEHLIPRVSKTVSQFYCNNCANMVLHFFDGILPAYTIHVNYLFRSAFSSVCEISCQW